MQFKKDVQSEIIDTIPINKVGIKDVLRKIEIIKDINHFSINAKINAFISLPGIQRGIHMSRTIEGIEYVINDASIQPVENIETFCLRILDALLKDHSYTDHAEVEMRGELFVRLKPSERDQSQRAYEMYSKAIGDRMDNGEIKKDIQVGISAFGITACPCAQEMSREYAKDMILSRKDLKISEDQIDRLLNVIPLASHNQRAKGQIIVGGGNGQQELVDVLKLVNVIESSMSGQIRSVLKRPDEAELVRIAHLNPKFVEDVVRDIAKKMGGPNFQELPDECSIQISVDAHESIHYHNAYAEIITTFGKIRNRI